MKRLLVLLCGLLTLTACHKKERMAQLPKPVKLPSIAVPAADSSETADNTAAPAAPAATADAAPAPEAVESRPLTPQELERLRYIVYMFHEEYGRYPSALTDLSATGMLTGFSAPIPNNYVAYDPSTGNLVASK